MREFQNFLRLTGGETGPKDENKSSPAILISSESS
jgi:hypothetical protein